MKRGWFGSGREFVLGFRVIYRGNAVWVRGKDRVAVHCVGSARRIAEQAWQGYRAGQWCGAQRKTRSEVAAFLVQLAHEKGELNDLTPGATR